MKVVFADTLYWVAVSRPNDQWREAATDAKKGVGDVVLVTSDEVLTEFLNLLSKSSSLRATAVQIVRAILKNPNVKVIPQTREGFLRALERYENRRDKEYSLTDCVSMNIMESEGIGEALTNDHHFEQEGFTVLIRKSES